MISEVRSKVFVVTRRSQLDLRAASGNSGYYCGQEIAAYPACLPFGHNSAGIFHLALLTSKLRKIVA